ncbi:MAG: helix-turn-helix domain-containing protein [Miltoncostaeaceae bacterium]
MARVVIHGADTRPEHLTTAEAAQELRCCLATVQRMIRRGDLPARLVAGRYLISRADLPTTWAPIPPRPRPRARPRSHDEARYAAVASEIESSR